MAQSKILQFRRIQDKAKCRGIDTMATSTAASDVVRGLGVLTTFWKKVEGAIRDAGGNDEHIARLAKDDSNSAIRQFAEAVVKGAIGVISSFRDQIRAGNYDYTHGFANNPDEIKGQSFHSVMNKTLLDHPGKHLITQRVFDLYGDKMASLSEFLDYGIKNPETQREFPLGIVWKDETGQFWYADFSSDSTGRGMNVDRDHPDDEWHDHCRFLVRK